MLELKDFVTSKLRWPEPIVLNQVASQGLTILEKFERYARQIDVAFVLMTEDDVAAAQREYDQKGTSTLGPRARQNVIFELGYFLGLMRRKSGNVIVFRKGRTELFSDMYGLAYIDISNGIKAAGEDIRTELSSLL
jgi:predicted nucleotide-binding protein